MSTVRSEATRERKKENERDGEDEDGKEALPYRKESVSSSISLQHDIKILMSIFPALLLSPIISLSHVLQTTAGVQGVQISRSLSKVRGKFVVQSYRSK